jgi:hypothetical protein
MTKDTTGKPKMQTHFMRECFTGISQAVYLSNPKTIMSCYETLNIDQVLS